MRGDVQLGLNTFYYYLLKDCLLLLEIILCKNGFAKKRWKWQSIFEEEEDEVKYIQICISDSYLKGQFDEEQGSNHVDFVGWAEFKMVSCSAECDFLMQQSCKIRWKGLHSRSTRRVIYLPKEISDCQRYFFKSQLISHQLIFTTKCT